MAIARFLRRIAPYAWMVVILLATLAPAPVPAQVLGTWAPATPYGEDDIAFGGFVLLGEPIGLVGHFRTGIGAKTDIGIQVGFPDFDFGDETLFGVAGDVKHLFFPQSGDFPVDLAGDIAFGYQTAGDFDLVDFDFGPVASKKFLTDGGTTLIPYGGLMFMIGNDGGTDLDLQARLGLDYPFRPGWEFLAELNIGSRAETISISGGFTATY